MHTLEAARRAARKDGPKAAAERHRPLPLPRVQLARAATPGTKGI